jgi:hypothetical protein
MEFVISQILQILRRMLKSYCPLSNTPVSEASCKTGIFIMVIRINETFKLKLILKITLKIKQIIKR